MEGTEESIRDAKKQRRAMRNHATEITEAEKMKLALDTGEVRADGEKLLGVEGEEAGGESEESADEEMREIDEAEEKERERWRQEREFVEPFNLKGEMKEGFFDKDGSYVWQRREQADAWELELEERENEALEATGTKDSMRAKKARTLAEVDEEAPPASRAEMKKWLSELVSLLQPGESPIHALKRLRPAGKNLKGAKSKTSKAQPEETKSPEDSKAKFDRLTELADSLMSAGMYNVYNDTRDKHEAALNPSKKRGRDEDSNRTHTPTSGDPVAPESANFEFQESSGIFFDAASGVCYDPNSKLYFVYDPSTQAYHNWNTKSRQFEAPQT